MHRLWITVLSSNHTPSGELLVTNPGDPDNDEVIHRWVYSHQEGSCFIFRGEAAHIWARVFGSQGISTRTDNS